jgi:DNA-binding transcriptional MocR family regulator
MDWIMDADVLAAALGSWRTGDRPLYQELADAVAVLVRSGVVPPGARLPAERALAATLNVSRGTVVAAYEHLRANGLASTRHGSGTIVGDPVMRGGERDAQSAATLAGPHIFQNLLRPSAGTIDFSTADWDGGEGLPDALFDLTDADAQALRRTSGYVPTGIPRLREAVAGYLTTHGAPTDTEQILVTTGAHQAISLLTQFMLEAGDTVVTEELTYPGAINVFRAAGAHVRVARHTRQGVDVASLIRTVEATAPKIVYLVPDGHNPTGIVSADLAKRRLAELAPTWQALVVEDASLWPTQFDGRLRPPIAGLRDRRDEGVLVGSASKISWAGLRVGWVRGPADLVSRLARLKLLDDLGTAVTDQLIAARILEQSDVLFPRRRAEIVERLEHLTSLLATHLPAWRWQRPASGLVLWVQLPGEDATAFCNVASHHGVHVVPGSVAAPAGSHGDHLRLPIGKLPEDHTEGVRRLAAAWDDYLAAFHQPGQVRVVV